MKRTLMALAGLALLAPAMLTPSSVAAAPTGGSAASISFKEPVDFATGAEPSSAAFNAKSGDQVGLTLARAPLSDSVATGDFNRDGKLDVAQTNVIAGSVSILLGDGRGGFAAPQQHQVGQHPVFIVAGDLDRDGKLDLAVADFGSNDVAILRGAGDGGFAPAAFVAVAAPRNVAIGKFNGDDIPDLAVASSPPGTTLRPTAGAVAILTGTAAGAYVPVQLIGTTMDDRPMNASYVAAGDFNRDGRDDLAVGVGVSANAGDRQSGDARLTGDDALIFLNRREVAGQPFNAAPEQRIRVGAWPCAISVADLDGDGDADVAVLDAASGDVTTLMGDGRGRFARAATNVTVGAFPRSLATGDFDDDGNVDVVTASFQASTVSVLRGNGDGTLQPAVDFWSGDATSSVAVGDFDADGRVDLAAGRLRDDQLVLLRNDSPRSGDCVRIERDVPYINPKGDPLAAHHTLDVYVPPPETVSFAGAGRPYPVVVFGHGGAGLTGDKSMVTYVMRSLARQGLVGVSVNYRLGAGQSDGQTADFVQAFRWVRDHIGSGRYGGDPRNIFMSGHSAGGDLASTLATDARYSAEQKHIRGLVLTSGGLRPGDAAVLPPSLVLNGEREVGINGATYAAVASQRSESTHVIVAERDHITLVSNLARPDDPGRAAILSFIRRHLLLSPAGVGADVPTRRGQPGGTLPATGAPAALIALGLLFLAGAALTRRNH